MHCLEVIITRNAHAAGREAGHATNDYDLKHRTAIFSAQIDDVIEHGVESPTGIALRNAFSDGLYQGMKEN